MFARLMLSQNQNVITVLKRTVRVCVRTISSLGCSLLREYYRGSVETRYSLEMLRRASHKHRLTGDDITFIFSKFRRGH